MKLKQTAQTYYLCTQEIPTSILNSFNVFYSKITCHIQKQSDLAQLQSFSVD